jgi:hypothetical protein
MPDNLHALVREAVEDMGITVDVLGVKMLPDGRLMLFLSGGDEKIWTPPHVEASGDAPPATAVANSAGRVIMEEREDDLTQLTGLGETYAQRLRAAGIVSFQQIITTDAAELHGILRNRSAPIAAWREEIGRYA